MRIVFTGTKTKCQAVADFIHAWRTANIKDYNAEKWMDVQKDASGKFFVNWDDSITEFDAVAKKRETTTVKRPHA